MSGFTLSTSFYCLLFKAYSTNLALRSYNIVDSLKEKEKNIKVDATDPKISFFLFPTSVFLVKTDSYITHNATWSQSVQSEIQAESIEDFSLWR